MRVLLSILILWMLWGDVSAKEVDRHEIAYQIEEDQALPSCEDLLQFKKLCQLLREARERVQQIPLTIFRIQLDERKGSKVTKQSAVWREFAIVAYDPATKEWHNIVLAMPLTGTSTFQPIVRTVHEPPYEVTRVKGQTFNKMLFEVRMGGRELFAYAGKHLSVPSVFRGRDVKKMRDEAVVTTYLATPPYLANEEFARLGKLYVTVALKEALRDLKQKRIVSKAFPGKLVSEVVTPEMLLNLLVTEQTDPCLLVERDQGCIRLIPAALYQKDEDVVNAVLTEFVLNGFDAYRYICSVAAACGAFQFTNNRTKKSAGTYTMVGKLYPEADLDPSFKRGTQRFFNSAKAAALLIDLELSSRGTPNWVRTAFVEDQRMGLLFPAAAYNGGASQSRRLAQLMEEYRRLKQIVHLTFETFPWEEFLDWVKSRSATLKRETQGYVKKAVSNWRHTQFDRSVAVGQPVKVVPAKPEVKQEPPVQETARAPEKQEPKTSEEMEAP